MNQERIPTFADLGGDFDESRLAIEEILTERLGDPLAVQDWMETKNNEFLDGRTPWSAIHVDPDKVVVAAFSARLR